jgi:RHS repeat-associated protein
VFDGEETIYLGELYERRARAGAATEHVFYVVGEKPLAEVVWEEPATGPVVVARKLFIHEDRLGSVEKVTNGQGQIEEARKYDPFGAQIDIRDLTRPPSAVSTSTRTGYTGHEGDMGGLVNMRGRIYDPATMRFLTTDPLVSAPGDAQSWNPYSYVVNNPLAYVDPTGFQREERVEFEDDDVCKVTGGCRAVQRYDENDGPGSINEPAPAPSSRGTFDDSGVSQALNDPAFNQVSSTPGVRVNAPPRRVPETELSAAQKFDLGFDYQWGYIDVDDLPDALNRFDRDFWRGIERASWLQALSMMGGSGLRGPGPGPRWKRPTYGHASATNGATRGGRATTGFIDDVVVKSHGKVVGRGTVDVRATVEGIQSGKISPRDVFRNDQGLLPKQGPGYYQEFVHPTPGVSGAGSQRIVRGQGGELFYTPDHYKTFIPLN